MLDLHILRENPDLVAENLQKRGFSFDVQKYKELEELRKKLAVETQNLQHERNQKSKQIGMLKAKNEDITSIKEEVNKIGAKLEKVKAEYALLLQDIDNINLSLPNMVHASVPLGKNENDNEVVKTVGDVPKFDFPILAHDELGEKIGQMDFALASKITGSRFVVLKRDLAKLQRAIAQFMLDVHINEHGYEEIYVPYIVNGDSLRGTGQLPKFEEDLFKIAGDHEYYLASTAEIPVTNTVRKEILDVNTLPLRYVCYSPCFRSEAGSYGKDTKGMIRQHQFEKVELVWVTSRESSHDALEELTKHAEAILQKLKLPYRVVNLCTGDIGNSAAKTYDLEVWLPSQNTYREISSCSNMEAFQARRLQARYKDINTGQMVPVHTLNGSGLAVGRTLVAILENYQNKDNSITVPEVLRPYMHGQEKIQ